MGKAESTRAAIVQATLDLSLKHGFAGVTLQMIGTEVGISHGAVHKHYPDKESLLRACAETAATVIRSYVDSRIDPMTSAAEQLLSHMEGNLEWVPKFKREMAIIVALYYQTSFSDPIRKVFEETYRTSVHRIAAIIAQGNREGCWNAPDPLKAARMIHNLQVGESFKIFIAPRGLSLKQRSADVWQCVLNVLKAKKDPA